MALLDSASGRPRIRVIGALSPRPQASDPMRPIGFLCRIDWQCITVLLLEQIQLLEIRTTQQPQKCLTRCASVLSMPKACNTAPVLSQGSASTMPTAQRKPTSIGPGVRVQCQSRYKPHLQSKRQCRPPSGSKRPSAAPGIDPRPLRR
jgi:hypothetical protein